MKLLLKLVKAGSMSFLISTTFANVIDGKFTKAYKNLNSKSGVGCNIYGGSQKLKRINNIFKANQYIQTNYKYGSESFAVRINLVKTKSWGKEKLTPAISVLNTKTSIPGIIDKKNFVKFSMKKLTSHQASMASKINLRALNCIVEVAVEPAFKITKNDIHINVHPHTVYDYYDRSTKVVNQFYSDKSLQQITLLDDYYIKGRASDIPGVLKGTSRFNYKQLQTSSKLKVSPRASILVSPAGHNEYSFAGTSLRVNFTGGNHNYCMWNNTRRIFKAFLSNTKSKHLDVIYHLDGTVVQRGGIIKGLSIPKFVFKQSNLLKDVFNNMSNAQRTTYHNAYLNYFRSNYLAQYNKLYRNVKITYLGKTYTVKGKGQRDYSISMRYQ